MLISLNVSAIFLLESLAIVFIFTGFFALAGLHLFHGIFHYRCVHSSYGIPLSE